MPNDSVNATGAHAATSTPSNPHAMEITAPAEDDFFQAGIPEGAESALGSHRDDTPAKGDKSTKTEAKAEDATASDNDDEVPEDKIPKRLRGKTLAQVYEEFAGLEKEYSRLGNEYGEQRKTLRELLELTLKSQQPNGAGSSEGDEEIDFHSAPEEAVERAVKKALKPVEQKLLTTEQRLLQKEFNERHPGYLQTAASEEFQDWIKSSSYRTRLFQAAAAFDMDAAEDLFSEWEARANATKADSDDDAGEREDAALKKRRALRKNATETGGAGKSAGSGGKKIYKSSELAKLYITNREKYNEMMPEIIQAYQEGRVK